MVGDRPHVSLLRGDTPEWRLWSLPAELASRIKPESWVLIGGQMVALHMHLGGATPRRTTTDVDIVADVLTERTAFQACKAAAKEIGTRRSAVDYRPDPPPIQWAGGPTRSHGARSLADTHNSPFQHADTGSGSWRATRA
jgi:hypothetical protein